MWWESYKDQEIDLFMEELGVYDDEMDTTDPKWTTPLGVEVYAYLVRQKMAEWAVSSYSSNNFLSMWILLGMELKKSERVPPCGRIYRAAGITTYIVTTSLAAKAISFRATV